MIPEEKVAEMHKLYPYLCVYAKKWLQIYVRTFMRTKQFPSCYLSDIDLTSFGFGKWTLVAIAESKSNIRKGIATFRAFQTFHVSHAKNPLNNGTGIYELVADDYGNIRCHEFTPHYFNRLRERHIAPKGIVQPTFSELVRRMICEQWSSMDQTIKGFRYKQDESGRYALVEDHDIDRKDGFDNLVSYHRDGLSMGVSGANRNYFLFLTYVSNELLYPNQVEEQKRLLSELSEYDLEQRYNPFATLSRKEWRPIKIIEKDNQKK